MIRKIKSLCTNILARILPATTEGEKGINAERIVRRRVEVTVEKETLSILVPGDLAGRAERVDAAKSSSERGLSTRSEPKE